MIEDQFQRDPKPLKIANRTFKSRLFVGTGKFSSTKSMRDAIELSCTEMVTVALRRIDLTKPMEEEDIIASLDLTKIQLLPNTSGARDAEEAVRLARIAREMGGGNWIKLEVTPDPYYLLPDGKETLKATEILVKEGFVVLPYIQADPILAKQLQEAGAATVMPLGSPIGSNQGIRTKESIKIIIEQAEVPVVIDAGLGLPSHVAEAFEMGADAVLVNTAIAISVHSGYSAFSFALATLAGREAYLNGIYGNTNARTLELSYESNTWKKASASSPLTGFLDEENR
ncbi:MAG: thiazole synthase [Leptospiraceae bacterium]|nr:thiazole synthase [Leptospiraceae bacterium]MDW7976272.1 thiazole synthase [Leptospiraceae bacterium]